MSIPDNNYPYGNWSGISGINIHDLILQPPNRGSAYDDIFKLSAVCNSTFSNVSVVAGSQIENALDMNNGSSGNTFTKLKLDAGHEVAVYIKGGSCNNSFDDVLITKIGGHSDLYLGDYSDQSKAKTTGNKFNNWRRIDGKPVRVSWNFFRADKPVLTDSVVTYQYLLSFVRTCYVELKYLFPRLIP